ncbi:hypothetical protein CKN86_13275 [Carnobacterium divergens]|uniref:hypothetical protein n=1 Tax=Carnobacterium divergens TaxID=2748 RepID=UPI000D48A385|nr:hypothetical protein [Carnobacterium divergens]MCO6019376.1 hypothetical protein [Carnobacterium divergens]MPQ23473.1 hypothetical protein [Carnobacterium divergens]TFI62088.1 hypothetical protein CKN62_07740 [Carnobacterium divergens]TFI86772.1 hypothetical protein CKN84_13780 [Carnobacterium divergens]TFJ01830.1 hypothetical protein CKN86_13275 [Carnobacterium divergens]
MLLTTGQEISATNVHGEQVTGIVTAILKNTVIVSQSFTNELVPKEILKTQGYTFTNKNTGPKAINVRSTK